MAVAINVLAAWINDVPRLSAYVVIIRSYAAPPSERRVLIMRKATILAVAVLLYASASAYAETAQVKTPDGRTVTCTVPSNQPIGPPPTRAP